MPKTKSKVEPMVPSEVEDTPKSNIIPEGFIPDYISGTKNIKDSPKEQVRQRIARALLHEYAISNDDMESDFSVTIPGKRKKVDVAIFHHESEHVVENMSRVVVCRPEPKIGRNFGSDIPITDAGILDQYDLAATWERAEDGNFRRTGRRQGSVAPEILFVERCVKWLKPGGRAGIVLPDGILGNPAAEYIRWWILHHTWVLASVDLPVEAFIHEANVNILTSVLFLKRKTDDEMRAEGMGGKQDYPVFMAVAEKVGIDRRGNKLYKRTPDGEEILIEVESVEKIRIGEKVIERNLRRRERISDNDLPEIVKAYQEFRRQYPEPGI